MKPPTKMVTDRVAVADVQTRNRIRPVSEAGVDSLLASIGEVGVMKDPIHVRKRKDGALVLIAGAHRLETARRLGWETIPATVWTDVTDDWCRLMEIDDNLAGAEMSALDTAIFLARRKEVYERMHPQSKAAVGAALVSKRWNTADIVSVVSFAKATADKFGLSDRHVRRMIEAGERIDDEQAGHLRCSSRPVTLKDLIDLAKEPDRSARDAAIRMRAFDECRTIRDALRTLRPTADTPPGAPEGDVEEGFKELMKLWGRVPLKARRKFVAAHRVELLDLVGDDDAEDGE